MFREDGPDLQIFWTEIVAPFTDAVGLVDREEGAVEASQNLAKAREEQPLGGDVEHTQVSALKGVEASRQLPRVEGRGQEGRFDTELFESVDLVPHQRDEWRDDDRRTRQQQGRKLVAETLATAGRRDQQQVLFVEQPVDRLLLSGAKAGMWSSFDCSWIPSGMTAGS